MILWRISNHVDLSGLGGVYAPGRWHDKGTPVLYCCEHPATALLEILVQTKAAGLPDSIQMLEIHCPDDTSLVKPAITRDELMNVAGTRSAGQAFLDQAVYCLLKVPSAVLPVANNVLVNPKHPEANRLTIVSVTRYPFDSRLL